MAIAFVQKIPNTAAGTTFSNVTTVTLAAFGAQPAAGNFIAVLINRASDSGMGVVDDNAGNTYTAAWTEPVNTTPNPDYRAIAFYKENIATTASLQVTARFLGASYGNLDAVEYSGVATSGSANGTPATATGNSSSPAPGSISDATGNNLYMTTHSMNVPGTVSGPGGSWTDRFLQSSNANAAGSGADLIGSGTQTPVFSNTSSGQWVAGMAAFKQAAAGGAAPMIGSGLLLSGYRNAVIQRV